LIFKAEVGTVGAGVAQIQGVWVKPEYRGKGVSVPAMAAVVKLVLADLAPVVSLYVNDYNEVALKTYRSVGFEQVDTFATVLFS
jgi:predicted GNAT family acetyltransferase